MQKTSTSCAGGDFDESTSGAWCPTTMGEIQNQMSRTAPLGNTYSNTMSIHRYIYMYIQWSNVKAMYNSCKSNVKE